MTNGECYKTVAEHYDTFAEWCTDNQRCIECPYYLGWIQIRISETVLVDRPRCSRFNDVCQPRKHECDIKAKGEAK